MALFVDGHACSIDDLTDQDAGLLNVALGANINVSTKIRLALGEILTDLELWLKKPQRTLELPWTPTIHMDQVVLTPPLKRWAVMHSLAMVYRDAYFSQLVDRYQAKWQEYKNLTHEARESFIASGLGVVCDPVAQAAPPVLSMTPGPQTGGTFYARVSWVNSNLQEGMPSEASSLMVTDGNLMTVAAVKAPKNAVGFNVFVGTSLRAMFLQNDELLPVDASYLYVPQQMVGGRLPGKGQEAEFIRPLARVVPRG